MTSTRFFAICSVFALGWLLAARIFGPSDLWDQSQPRTIAYTSDIVANGRWILPVERGRRPATKPVLYNWLAAPGVRVFGYASEIAHKLPSLVALVLTWGLVVQIGRRIGRALGPAYGVRLGWIAGLVFVASYPVFKLGYLARPDMLLTLWLVAGWFLGTIVLVDAANLEGEPTLAPTRRRLAALGFWTCVALATLTKGPAAAVLPVYGLVGARLVAGRWGATTALGWWWGVPLAVVVGGSWYALAWTVDPGHVERELWYEEVLGRVTGLGRETPDGPRGLLVGAPMMPGYYLVRFVPWSIVSIVAMLALWWRFPGETKTQWRRLGRAGGVLMGATIFIFVVLGLYTLSAGKRADYAAAAYAPGALLVAWWCLFGRKPLADRAAWTLPATAAIILGIATWRNQTQTHAPSPEFGDAILDFAREAGVVLAAEPMPVVFLNTGVTPVPALLGHSEPDDRAAFETHIRAGESFWVLYGGYPTGPNTFETMMGRYHEPFTVRPVVRSAELPEAEGWPVQVSLFRVEAP